MHSLQVKIFTLFVGLLLIVQSIAILTIYRATEEQSEASINTRLTNATTIFKSLFESNTEKLSAIAEAAAQDGGLRENFYEDQRSFLVALNNHRKRINADLAMAIDDQQNIKSQLVQITLDSQRVRVTKGSETGTQFRHGEWLLFPSEEYLYELDNQLYQMSVASVKSGTENIGWIAFGFLIGQKVAHDFEELTGLTTDFIVKAGGDKYSIASSDSETEVSKNPIENNDLPTSGNRIAALIELGQVGSQGNKFLTVELHGRRDDLLDSIEKRWLQFLALAGATLILSLGGAYVISASITRPVTKLVNMAKIVAEGNYEEKVEIADKGEMGQLAREFGVMQKQVLAREKQILHRAFHDPLTELPNRNKLVEELGEYIKSTSSPAMIYLLNISHINDINSSLGHQVGDTVIKEFATRLLSFVGYNDLYHVGADEFAFVVKGVGENQISELSDKISEVFEKPYIQKSMTFNLRSKSGISFYPEHSDNAEELLQKASVALNFAKLERAHLKVYDSSQDVDTLEQLNLINDLSTALEENQLVLYYQPKVSLEQNKVETVEALVRWVHPKLGMVPPDKFISIAEKTGLINPLTDWVLGEAMSQFSIWKAKNIELVIAVNISAENLKAPEFYSSVCQMVEDAGISTEAIMLEITESAVVDNPSEAIAILQRFRDRGFKLSIDDYGTGYSSLAQLKDLPVDELKIDMSFVKRLPHDDGDKIIVRSTIELAHNMGLTVVAEGVENELAMNWLRDKGCERAQGYHISRPVPANELESWLTHSPFYDRAK